MREQDASKIEKLVRKYSYITWGAVIYGVLAAHLPFIIGFPWSTCEVCAGKLACVLVFHLYEVPLVSFNGYFAYYGLNKFSMGKARRYMSLLNFVVMVNLAFFTFETGLLLDSIRRSAPLWETLALSSVALILVGGSLFGIYVKQRLEAALEIK